MKQLTLALMAVTTLLACGTGRDPTPCDQADALIEQGLDDFCAPKADQCWTCRCHMRDQEVLTEFNGDSKTYSCVDPDPCLDDPGTSMNECDCKDENETNALACLADPDECLAPFLSHASAACAGAPIE